MMAQYSLTWELFSQNFKGLLQNTSFQNFDLPKPPIFEKPKVNRKNLSDQRVFNNPIHTHDAMKISNQFSSTPPPVITFRPSSLISESENTSQSMRRMSEELYLSRLPVHQLKEQCQ